MKLFKRLLSVFLMLLMVMTMPFQAFADDDTDYRMCWDYGQWTDDYCENCADDVLCICSSCYDDYHCDVTNGMSDTKFAPNNTCTRGQVVTFLYRAFK